MAFNRSVVGKSFSTHSFEYGWQRVALYALACGADENELDLLLENRGPKVLPTFSVVVAFKPLYEALSELGGNLLTLVHGGQRCTLHRPIPSEARLSTTCKITALYDKGKGALALFETKTADARGEPLFDTEWQIFYRGEGGFGGERGPDAPAFDPPVGQTPAVHTAMTTSHAQALLYRLASEDLNPIHSDPDVAKMAGFPRPILHGLCTFGFACRAAVNGIAGGDARKVSSIEGRFSKPVLPGDTIVTDMWKRTDKESVFVTSVDERKEAVITLGRVTLF